MKTPKLSYLIGLFSIGLALTVFTSCTTEDIEETENLQILDNQSTSTGSGASGGSGRPMSG